MADTNEDTPKVEKSTELVEILVDNNIFFKDWKGNRTKRDVKTGDGKHKLTFYIPVPKTDEEAKDLFNLSITDLLERAVKQLSYSADTNINKTLKDKIAKGFDFSKLEDVTDYATSFQNDLFVTPKEKKAGVAKIAKKKAGTLDAIGAGLGLTPEQMATMGPEELVAMIKKAKK